MKILLDGTLLNVGGSIQVGLSIIENAAKTNTHLWNVVLSKALRDQLSPEILKPLNSVDVISMNTKLDRFRLFKILPYLERKYRPDVIFTIFGPSYWKSSAPQLQGFANPTIIYDPQFLADSTPDRSLFTKAFDPFKSFLFRRADYLVVETETVRERLEKRNIFPKERVFVVRNSYSPLFLKSIENSSKNISGSIFRILVPASYYRHKNLESIPGVAQELRKKTSQPFEFIFTLPLNDPWWQKIESKVKKMGLHKLIYSMGAVPHGNIGKLYRESNAVFLPTMLECSTAVYPETFMAGLPLATSDLDFAHELCDNAAIYFNPSLMTDMADCLFRLMNESSTVESLIKNGAEVLKRNFTTPEEKWLSQLECLKRVGELGKPKR